MHLAAHLCPLMLCFCCHTLLPIGLGVSMASRACNGSSQGFRKCFMFSRNLTTVYSLAHCMDNYKVFTWKLNSLAYNTMLHISYSRIQHPESSGLLKYIWLVQDLRSSSHLKSQQQSTIGVSGVHLDCSHPIISCCLFTLLLDSTTQLPIPASGPQTPLSIFLWFLTLDTYFNMWSIQTSL